MQSSGELVMDVSRRGPASVVRLVGAVGMAVWTGFTLKFNLFQHPQLVRHSFRMPDTNAGRVWRKFANEASTDLSIRVEHRPAETVWVHLKGQLSSTAAVQFVADLQAALARKDHRVVLNMAHLAELGDEAASALAAGLKSYSDRIRIILPVVGEFAALVAIFPLYR